MCKRARACDASATSPFFFGNRVQLSPWWAKRVLALFHADRKTPFRIEPQNKVQYKMSSV